MSNAERPRITIVVSGGMVENVYTTSEIDMEVDILDFDDNGWRPDEGRAELNDHYARVRSEQRSIY